MLSLDSLVSAVVYLIVGGLVVGLLLWTVDYCAREGFLPAPFNKVAKIIIVVVSVLIVISVLLGLAGHPVVRL